MTANERVSGQRRRVALGTRDLTSWASAGREGAALSREYAVQPPERATPAGQRIVPARRERPRRRARLQAGRQHLQEDPMTYEVTKTDEQWALELEPQEFAVLRRAGTERAVDRGAARREARGRLPLSRVRQRAVPLRHQVRLALRLAQLLLPAGRRPGRADQRPQPGHGPHRGALRAVRFAPRARVRRRPADPDGRPVLHELGEPDVRADRLTARSFGVSSGAPGPTPRTGDVRMVDTAEVACAAVPIMQTWKMS